MIFLGICAIFLAFIPIWFTGLSIELDFPQDRLTLPISLGSAFLTTGIIKTIIRNNVINNLIFCLLIGFSTGFHFLNTISYIKDWELFNSFFWQLKWRAPMIKQGTTILSDNFPLKYYSDNSLTAPLNWIYDSSNHSKDLNYMFYFLEVRLGRRLPALEKGLTINQPFRSFSFTGSTSDMLILFFNPPACMHIIDNEIDFLYPKIPLTLKKAIPLSKPEVILPEAEITLPSVFIKEPRHDWCYYYQRAELARQNKDWEEIKYLDQAAKEFNEKPEETIELSPFIEAYANLSEWQTAIQYSKFIHQDSPKSDQFQCKLWKRIIENKSPGEVPEEVTRLFFADLGCR